MAPTLSRAQIDAFHDQGYLFPLPALSAAEAARCRRGLEALERGGKPKEHINDIHLLFRWAYDVVTDPRIVGPVSDVLGPDVLCWSLNWFVKEPRDGTYVTYHQDATYWGLEPHDVVSAWIALSPAPVAAGPMRFVVGSHLWDIHAHEDTFADGNLLSRGQVIQRDIDEADTVLAPLETGEMSIHHVRLVHGSGPNETGDRRIGMVIRYAATRVRQTKLRDTAVLVRGEDRYGHFDLFPAPATDGGAEEFARHAEAIARTERIVHSMDYE